MQRMTLEKLKEILPGIYNRTRSFRYIIALDEMFGRTLLALFLRQIIILLPTEAMRAHTHAHGRCNMSNPYIGSN